ncbi:MAG: oxaloacetate decarboxylase gamma chain [uncultured Sulfurimonas sp.]|nr:MAG: oxaloacetate decarboxylase gamma chain [uncultured Sulfurimonas sp.]CAI6154263.1 MAG: oxaloacetate decarboxylase gamma chain [uncultured Sulfurimonas sp.]
MNKGNLMETNLIVEGFKFMGLGMGTVFIFLIIMIASMNIMSIFIHKFFPESKPEINPAPKQDNKKITAAITAAISHHRQG